MNIKILLKSIREYKKESILASIFVILEVFMEILIPIEIAKIVDIGIKANAGITYIVKEGIILAILALLALIFGILSGNSAAIGGAGFAKNLRKDIMYKIQEFSFKNIDKFSASSLVTRLTTDITNVQMAYVLTIRLFVRTQIIIILALVMTYRINFSLGVVFSIIIPILATVLFFIVKIAYPNYVKGFGQYDVLNNVVSENVNASRVVKSFVREEHEISKFEKISRVVYDLFLKAESAVALNSFVMQFTIYTIIVFIMLIGGKNVVYGNMGTGELTSVTIYAIQILMALMMMTFVFVMILIAQASIKRISEVLLEELDLTNKENTIKDVKNGDIEFDNVNFSYSGENGNLSLKNINLKIKSGQTVGIIGGTGTSKSTLVQLIPRLYDVVSGSVKVAGVDVRDYEMSMLREEVAMVLQKNVLFSGTIKENIKWGNPNASDEEVIKVAKLASAHKFIEEFPDKYDTKIVQGGNNVSGGQKQRICIARALLKKPKILILDDSTSAVDTKTEYLIRKAFKEEIPNTTKIIIAQRISSIENADLIIVMEDGKIDGMGSMDELLKNNEIFKEIYESQVKGGENGEEKNQ